MMILISGSFRAQQSADSSCGSVSSRIYLPPPGRLETYFRLGKKASDSGILYLTSRSALSFQAAAVMPTMTKPATAVLAFQLCGCAYQPPEGDQTCFG